MSNSWEEKWIEDIDYLKDNLIGKHKNLFFNISREEFEDKLRYLKSLINELDYDEMKVELSRVVASVRDAHTSLAFPVKKYIPLKFYWFKEGIYIVDTTDMYKHLLYKKILSIEGMAIDKVMADIREIVSCENEYFFKAKSMNYLNIAEVLYGLIIIDSTDKVKIGLEDEEVELETVYRDELVYINNELPQYLKEEKDNFCYKYFKDSEELYIYYNSCREKGDIKIENKITEVINYINRNQITKVTIDLSNNLGGDSRLIRPLIDYIKGNNSINTKENLKIKIGRETFSSALINAYEFKWETNGIIVGEPSGGKPNCFGEILRFVLPNSKFNVSYSTKYYKLIEDDSVMALYPDAIEDISIENFL
ncbi:peptidase S41 [Clostridium paraputrificum]|uniref:peptidase S41 n=1 Tax=Clostridium paraputrificum TaxID=29363 RepID=UPI003D32EB36